MATRWDAARGASRRRPYRAVGPVGERRYVHERDHVHAREDEHCWQCGYHVCSCKREQPVSDSLAAQQEPTPTRVALMSPYTGKPYMIHCKLCGVADGDVYGGSLQHSTCPDRVEIERLQRYDATQGVGGRHG